MICEECKKEKEDVEEQWVFCNCRKLSLFENLPFNLCEDCYDGIVGQYDGPCNPSTIYEETQEQLKARRSR